VTTGRLTGKSTRVRCQVDRHLAFAGPASVKLQLPFGGLFIEPRSYDSAVRREDRNALCTVAAGQEENTRWSPSTEIKVTKYPANIIARGQGGNIAASVGEDASVLVGT